MKNLLFFIIFIFIFLETSIAQYIYFNKRIDLTGPGNYEVCRAIITFNKGYMVAGGWGPGANVYLSFIDSIGNLKWRQDFTMPGFSYYFGFPGALFQTKDKYIAICGSKVPNPKGYSVLIKVDSIGNTKWEKVYQLSDSTNVSNSGSITNDSGYILTGRLSAIPHTRYLLLKADKFGNQQWYKSFTDNDPNRNYQSYCVRQTPDKGYCLSGGGGYWYNPGVEWRGIAEIIKTDSLGNQQWKKSYGNPLYTNGNAMFCLSNDSCIVVTYSNTVLYINQYEDYKQPYLSKIDLNGNVLWTKTIRNPQPRQGINWVQQLDNSDYILCGGYYIVDTLNKCRSWLFRRNCNGDSLWYREYEIIHGPVDQNGLYQVTPTPDNGFAAAGSLFPGSSGGTQDIWVLKTDSIGCLVPNCDAVNIAEFNPNEGVQMLIYPNPFKEAFAINYYIPKESKSAIFQLYDINGKLVYQTSLTKEVKLLQVVAGALSPGVYVANLIIDNTVIITNKLIKN